MTDPVGDEVVADVARTLVARAAPQELPLFPAVSREYFRDPQTVLGSQGGRDEMLGFGVEAAAILLTPAALEVAKSVVTFLVAQLQSAAEKESSDAIGRLVHRLFHRDEARASGDEPPELSRDELRRIRDVALDKARALKLPDAEATLLADSVVGSLAAA